MAKIYREVEDIVEPTPRPNPTMKQQPVGAPFDSQSAYTELKEGFSGLSERVEAMGNDVTDFKKKFDERFGAEQMEPGMEEPLEGEESTDPMDNDGMDVANANNTTVASPPQQNFEVGKQRLSARKSIVGGRAHKQQFDVKGSVKEFLKGYGGMM